MSPIHSYSVPRWVVRVCTLGSGVTTFSVSFAVFLAFAVAVGATRGVLFGVSVVSAAFSSWVTAFVWTALTLVTIDASPAARPGRSIVFTVLRGLALMTIAPTLLPTLLGGPHDLADCVHVLGRMETNLGNSLIMLATPAMLAGVRVRRARQARG